MVLDCPSTKLEGTQGIIQPTQGLPEAGWLYNSTGILSSTSPWIPMKRVKQGQIYPSNNGDGQLAPLFSFVRGGIKRRSERSYSQTPVSHLRLLRVFKFLNIFRLHDSTMGVLRGVHVGVSFTRDKSINF